MTNPKMSSMAFERLQEQVAAATVFCSREQMLILADQLHDAIRRRQQRRWEDRSFSAGEPAAFDC